MGEKRPIHGAPDAFKEDEPKKIFVGGLSRATGIESMKDYFGRFGTVADVIIMTDPTGTSRGFGFVTFDTTDSVDKTVEQQSHFLDNKQVDVKRSLAKHLRPPPKQVSISKKAFIGGIPADMNEADLKEFLTVYGQVSDCTIMYDEKSQKSRGFGFIGFEDESVTDKLLKQQFVQIRNRQVEIKPARQRANYPGGGLAQQNARPAAPGGGPPYDYGYGYPAPAQAPYGYPNPAAPPQYGGGYPAPNPYGAGYGYGAAGGYPPAHGYPAPQGYPQQQQPMAQGYPPPAPGYGHHMPLKPAHGPPMGGKPYQTEDPPAKRMKQAPQINGANAAAANAYDPSSYYAAAAAASAYANYSTPTAAPQAMAPNPYSGYPYGVDPSKPNGVAPGHPDPAASNPWAGYPGYGYPANPAAS